MAAGVHDGRDKIDTFEGQLPSANLSQPGDHGSASSDKGENDRQGRGVDIDRREIARKGSRLYLDTEIVEESDPSREGNDSGEKGTGQVYHSSTLTTTPNWKPDGEWTR